MRITDLPFNSFVGITSAAKEGAVLSLSNHTRYTNHLGTVHAGALLTLAEATSGAYLIDQFPALGFEVVPVVRRVDAKFRKPALGATYSRFEVSSDTREKFLAELTERGRALIEIKVDVHDEHGTHALAATFEWFVAQRDFGGK